MRAAPVNGRHRKQAARTGGDGPLALAAMFAAAVVLIAALTAAWAGRWAAEVWRELGLYRRLTCAMIVSFPAAVIASDVGAIPDTEMSIVTAGLAGVVFFWVWRWIAKRAGQARWAARKTGDVPVIDGEGWQEHVSTNAARITQLEAKVKDLFRLMSSASEAAGLPTPDGEPTGPMRRLRLVSSRSEREAKTHAG